MVKNKEITHMSPRSRSLEQTPMQAPFRSALSWAAAAALSSTSLAVTEAAPDRAAAIEAAPHLEIGNDIHN